MNMSMPPASEVATACRTAAKSIVERVSWTAALNSAGSNDIAAAPSLTAADRRDHGEFIAIAQLNGFPEPGAGGGFFGGDGRDIQLIDGEHRAGRPAHAREFLPERSGRLVDGGARRDLQIDARRGRILS